MGRIDDAARMQDVREALDPWERRERERLGKTGLQISPEVWEAQQQELGRLARRVAELEEENRAAQDALKFLLKDLEIRGIADSVSVGVYRKAEAALGFPGGIAGKPMLPAEHEPESPHNAPSLPQEPPVPVSVGDSASGGYAGMPWEGRP